MKKNEINILIMSIGFYFGLCLLETPSYSAAKSPETYTSEAFEGPLSHSQSAEDRAFRTTKVSSSLEHFRRLELRNKILNSFNPSCPKCKKVSKRMDGINAASCKFCDRRGLTIFCYLCQKRGLKKSILKHLTTVHGPISETHDWLMARKNLESYFSKEYSAREKKQTFNELEPFLRSKKMWPFPVGKDVIDWLAEIKTAELDETSMIELLKNELSFQLEMKAKYPVGSEKERSFSLQADALEKRLIRLGSSVLQTSGSQISREELETVTTPEVEIIVVPEGQETGDHKADQALVPEAKGAADPRTRSSQRGYLGSVKDQIRQWLTFPGDLKNFLSDMNDEISKSDRVFEQTDTELIRDMTRTLIRREGGNVMLTGESGSGKTEFVKSFVKKVMAGECLPLSQKTHFVRLDPSAMMAGTQYRGSFENRVVLLKQYLMAAKLTGRKIVLVVDEAHTLVGAGTHTESSIDFWDSIKAELADGSMQVIGITTHEEFEDYFGNREALKRRFKEISKPRIPIEQLPRILGNYSTGTRRPRLPNDIYTEIIRISDEFDAVGSELSRATKLLEEVYADLDMREKSPESLTVDDLRQTAGRLYRMNQAQFDPENRLEKLNGLQAYLDGVIVGKESVKRGLIDDAAQALTGVVDPGKPRVRRAFLGPKGLGKTYVPERFAEYMGLHFARINLAEYVSGRSADNLLSEIGSVIRKSPFAVILFDEVEKAPLGIQNVLLGLMDSNKIVVREPNGTGKFHSTVIKTSGISIFLASNAGESALLANPDIHLESLKAAAIDDGFSSPLLDRVAAIHLFEPPKTTDEFKAVLKMQLHIALKGHCEKHNLRLQIQEEENFLDALVRNYYKPGVSFRPALAALELTVSRALTQMLLRKDL